MIQALVCVEVGAVVTVTVTLFSDYPGSIRTLCASTVYITPLSTGINDQPQEGISEMGQNNVG
jgi:hypothetical protein